MVFMVPYPCASVFLPDYLHGRDAFLKLLPPSSFTKPTRDED